MLLGSSFVMCSGYMCPFRLRFGPPPIVSVLKPMVATASKVIAQSKSTG